MILKGTLASCCEIETDIILHQLALIHLSHLTQIYVHNVDIYVYILYKAQCIEQFSGAISLYEEHLSVQGPTPLLLQRHGQRAGRRCRPGRICVHCIIARTCRYIS